MRRWEEALVHVNAGARAGVAGGLKGFQEHPDVERTCRSFHASQHVGFEDSYLRPPRAGRAGSSSDLGVVDGGSSGLRCCGAVDSVRGSGASVILGLQAASARFFGGKD